MTNQTDLTPMTGTRAGSRAEDQRVWLNLVWVMLFLGVIACVLLPGMGLVVLLGNQCAVLDASASGTAGTAASSANAVSGSPVLVLLLLFIAAVGLAIAGVVILFRQRSRWNLTRLVGSDPLPADYESRQGKLRGGLVLLPVILFSCATVFCAGQFSLLRSSNALCVAIQPDTVANYSPWDRVQVAPVSLRIETLQAGENRTPFISIEITPALIVASATNATGDAAELTEAFIAAGSPANLVGTLPGTDLTVTDATQALTAASSETAAVATSSALTATAELATAENATAVNSTPAVDATVTTGAATASAVATITASPDTMTPATIAPTTTGKTATPDQSPDMTVSATLPTGLTVTADTTVTSEATTTGTASQSFTATRTPAPTFTSAPPTVVPPTMVPPTMVPPTAVPPTATLIPTLIPTFIFPTITPVINTAVPTVIPPTLTPVPTSTRRPPTATRTPQTTVSGRPSATPLPPTITPLPSATFTASRTPLPITPSVTPDIWLVDYAVMITVDQTTPLENSVILITIDFMNVGTPSLNVSGIHVTGLLPGGLTYLSHVASSGTYTPGTGNWVFNYSGSPLKTLKITARVNTGTGGTTIPLTAVITNNSWANDTNPVNDADQVTIQIISPPTDTPTPAALPLQLTFMGCNAPGQALYRVHNPNPVDTDFTWQVFGGTANGTGTAIANGDVLFTAPDGSGGQTMQIFVGGVLHDMKAAGGC